MLALLAAPACIMAGYDPAPLQRDVAPPGSGDGAAGGASGMSGGSGVAGSAGGSGSAASAGSGGSTSIAVRDVCGKAPAGSACDDGRPCTENDVCVSGYCVGTAKVCQPSFVECSPIVCQESTGVCINRALPDGSDCGISGIFRCVMGLCTRPQTCTTDVCNADCEDELSCLYQCPGASQCSAQCDPMSTCLFDCKNAGRCTHSCAAKSTCRVDCSGADACAVSCAAGAVCNVDCRGAADCGGIVCEAGATCWLTCNPGQSCAFERCDSGLINCAANVIGCGGCP